MGKGVEEPAVVGAAGNGDNPADDELGQVDSDETEVVEQKITVDGIPVEGMECWRHLCQKPLYRWHLEKPVEQDQAKVEDDQGNHQQIDNKTDRVQIELQLFRVQFDLHGLAAKPGPYRAVV